MGAGEVIVRIRRWVNQDESEDVDYSMSTAMASRASQLCASGRKAEAIAHVEREGHQLIPSVTIETDVF